MSESRVQEPGGQVTRFSSAPCRMTRVTGVGTPLCRSAIGRALVLERASHSTRLCRFQRKEAVFQKLTEGLLCCSESFLEKGAEKTCVFREQLWKTTE